MKRERMEGECTVYTTDLSALSDMIMVIRGFLPVGLLNALRLVSPLWTSMPPDHRKGDESQAMAMVTYYASRGDLKNVEWCFASGILPRLTVHNERLFNAVTLSTSGNAALLILYKGLLSLEQVASPAGLLKCLKGGNVGLASWVVKRMRPYEEWSEVERDLLEHAFYEQFDIADKLTLDWSLGNLPEGLKICDDYFYVQAARLNYIDILDRMDITLMTTCLEDEEYISHDWWSYATDTAFLKKACDMSLFGIPVEYIETEEAVVYALQYARHLICDNATVSLDTRMVTRAFAEGWIRLLHYIDPSKEMLLDAMDDGLLQNQYYEWSEEILKWIHGKHGYVLPAPSNSLLQSIIFLVDLPEVGESNVSLLLGYSRDPISADTDKGFVNALNERFKDDLARHLSRFKLPPPNEYFHCLK